MKKEKFKKIVKNHESGLMLEVALLRYDLEELILEKYDIKKILLIQSEMNLKEYFLKLIRLGKFKQLPYKLY